MLQDRRLRIIVDFIRDKDAFPTINVNGGVNYFLWNRDNPGDCEITTVEVGGALGLPLRRGLNEFDVFVRRNEAIPILQKVIAKKESRFSRKVSPLKPFGLRTHFHGASVRSAKATIKLYGSGAVTWVAGSEILANAEWVSSWKVLVAAATDGNENYPLPIWDHAGPFVAGPGEACTETYLVAALADNAAHAGYIRDYMRTKLFRFLVSLRKIAQHNKADNFEFVPDLPMDQSWTDAELYKRYGINKVEAAFIDSMIRTMDWRNE
jgi:site-specific DNA-methyltransferase (adenine-specific)